MENLEGRVMDVLGRSAEDQHRVQTFTRLQLRGQLYLSTR